MGTDDGSSTRSLTGLLEREPYRFDFYQAVRLLEQIRPEAIPVGHGGANAEPVAFRSKVGLDFPASDIVSAEFPEDASRPVRMTVAFMGLAGAGGPLPPPFTDLVIQRNAARDYATRDFLDIFNHRLISFLYRSRKKHRIALNSRPPEQTEWARWMFDLSGLEYASRKRDSRLWARSMLRYAGILAGQVRSMAGLEAVLSDFFRTRISGEQLLGRWLVIDPRDRTHIGVHKGLNNRLGVDTVVGRRAWDQMGRIRLRIESAMLDLVRDFLPYRRGDRALGDGQGLVALQRITRVYLNQDVDVDLDIGLAPGQRAGTRLSTKNDIRLGWTSWLSTGTSRPTHDRLRLRLTALEKDRSLSTGIA